MERKYEGLISGKLSTRMDGKFHQNLHRMLKLILLGSTSATRIDGPLKIRGSGIYPKDGT
ncbi:MAG: hypothetical protein GH145_01995 [Firmicutes bacterium]|nr:hypothetical protein [Bacillota bacterium]